MIRTDASQVSSPETQASVRTPLPGSSLAEVSAKSDCRLAAGCWATGWESSGASKVVCPQVAVAAGVVILDQAPGPVEESAVRLVKVADRKAESHMAPE